VRRGHRSLGLAAGLVADVLLADPPRLHPVAGFGRLAAAAERACWRPARLAGVGYLAGLTVPLAALAGHVERRLARRPSAAARAGYTATLAYTVFGGTSLHRRAAEVARALDRGDLTAARAGLPALCGRDPDSLDAAGIARAVIESVAENTSDAVVAPLLWGALTGPAGLAGYRAVNTLDAMVGHRSERFVRFGWAAARADDLVNLVPARVVAALATAGAPLVGGRPATAWRAWRSGAPAHPSPNAGPCEAAFAGALGVRLGGPTRYPYGVSARPWLGDGREPTPADIVRAVRLSRAVIAAAGLLAVALGGVTR
jgi:adenosylcobinamide-phosphate synthase